MTTLVLLPGMDGTGDLFQPLLKSLDFNLPTLVVAYPASEVLTYAELESIVRSQLPSGPFVLLGESFSGPVAISIAATHPENLRGVVLSCSFALCPRPIAAHATWLLSLPLPNPPIRLLSAPLLGSRRTPELRTALKRALAKVAPRVLRHRLVQALSVNVVGKLSAIEVPLMYLQAASDWVVPRSAWAAVSAALPLAQLQVVRGPHLLLQANPTESANAIQAFLSGVTNAA